MRKNILNVYEYAEWIHWKTSEIKRKLSVKSAELFALDYGAGQLCYLKELYGHFST